MNLLRGRISSVSIDCRLKDVLAIQEEVAEAGRPNTLSLPHETVIGLLKDHYETICAALTAAGVA